MPTLVVLAVLVTVIVLLSTVWTDVRWYSQIGAAQVYWKQWGWAVALGLIGTLFVGVIATINFSVTRASKTLEVRSGMAPYRKIADEHPWLVRLGVTFLAGIVFGAPLATEWRTYLTWFNRTDFGTQDAEFGKDVGFYVFSLPVMHSLLSLAITTLAVSAVVAILGHYLYGGISGSNNKIVLSRRARLHIGVLGAVGAVLAAGYFWLGRYDMLLANNDKFAGASFTDINASLPGLTILAIVALLIAVLFVVASIKSMWKLTVTGIAAAVVAGLVVGWAYPALVQNFRVTPNAVEMESEYIQRNIDATRTAYGLDDIETTNYTAQTEAEAGQLRADADTTTQIRLLDPTIVSPTFNQLQQNRQYYQFADSLSVDRYSIDGNDRDTVLAVRELNTAGLDNAQRTWVNDHTVYTHGYGVAAAYGNTTTNRGAPVFFQRDIPSVGEMGEYEPRVYFGQQSPDYSIVGAPEGSDPWEIDYPDDSAANGQVFTTYTGDGGPKLSNAWEKLMYAIKFRSTDMFFSDRVTSNSQILYDRDPQSRVSKVAPYLTLDSRAYPAVVDMDGDSSTPKRLVWIIDAYTTSNNYPYSARTSLSSATEDAQSKGTEVYGGGDEVNYVRNSVKAVVDAYDGSVKLYTWDSQDPILKAWDKIFPGMLTDVSQMSGDLMSHVRYPEDLFKVQRTLLTKYHVTDAAAFYSGGDFWNVPNEPTESSTSAGATAGAGSTEQQPPYYLTLQMPGQDSAQFSLTTGFVPGGTTKRNVMTGFLAVDSNAGNEAGTVREGYGKLRLLELPRDATVPGPGQAQNNFLTDSSVSRNLNLLRQGGTTVKMGNLLTLPVGGGLLYVQPVYVSASSGTQYPLVQYVLTAFGDGNKIGFAPTLDEALNQTFGGDSGAQAGDANIEKDDTPVTEDVVDGGTGTAPATPSAAPSEQPNDSAATPAAPAAPAGSAQERLNSALSNAQKALNDANSAMSNGDWAAYGEAQKALQSAIEQAVAAQTELDSNG
ncbi:UPF0182 family protein [Arcanobacterium haemolyticum]|nr:UPF0182 family protein [Arcanobacterium haemolyticum]